MGSHLVFVGLSHVYWEPMLCQPWVRTLDTITSFNPQYRPSCRHEFPFFKRETEVERSHHLRSHR